MSFRGNIGEVRETGSSGGGLSLQWRIPCFLSLDGNKGDCYDSPFFDGCGERWWLRILPKGLFRDTSSDEVSITLLRCRAAGHPLNLRVTLGILGSEGVLNRRCQEFTSENKKRSWNTFCRRSELEEEESKLMQGDTFVLELDMKTEQESRVAKGVEELQKSLHELLLGVEDTDILIKVRGKEFPAHKIILRARSPVFHAMFAHNMVEKQSGVVTMEDCDPEYFPSFLEHVYTGSTGMISVENVFSLYASADKYDLGSLKEACCEFIKSNLSVSCFCDAMTLAVKHGEKKLINCATKFFCSNAEEIMKTVEWEYFMKENTTVGNELILKTLAKLNKK